MTEESYRKRHPSAVTAVELADIAGVEVNTIRKIAGELFDMLEKDMENGVLVANEARIP